MPHERTSEYGLRKQAFAAGDMMQPTMSTPQRMQLWQSDMVTRAEAATGSRKRQLQRAADKMGQLAVQAMLDAAKDKK